MAAKAATKTGASTKGDTTPTTLEFAHGEGSVDDQHNKTGTATGTNTSMAMTVPSNSEEEAKRAQTERAGSQASLAAGLA